MKRRTLTGISRENNEDNFTLSKNEYKLSDVSDSPIESPFGSIKHEYLLQSDSHLQSQFNDPYFIRCLGETQLSRDSLLTNPYLFCPEIQDPHLETFLYETVRTEIFPKSFLKGTFDHYRYLCKKYRTPEIKKFEEMLMKDFVDFKYYALTVRALHAILETLSYNEMVEGFDFSSTYIPIDGMEYLRDTLMKNPKITTLCLENCSLTENESKGLASCIKIAQTLKVLNLNRNNLKTEGIKNLKEALVDNRSLEELYLSHNKINVDVGEELEEILLYTSNLKRLDLSWNFLHDADAIKHIVKGLQGNLYSTLEYLNMAWNGLHGKYAGLYFKSLLISYHSLNVLDLSHNRIYTDFLTHFLSGLKKGNCKLKELYFTGNSLKENDISMLLDFMLKTSLQKLDISKDNIFKDHLQMIEKFKRIDREVIYQNKVVGDYEIKEPDYQEILLNRCRFLYENTKKSKRNKKTSPRIFGTFFWSINSDAEPIRTIDFKKLIGSMECKAITKNEALVEEVYKAFLNSEKRFMIGAMRDKYLQMYPDTPKPPTPKIDNETEGKENENDKEKKDITNGKKYKKSEVTVNKKVKKSVKKKS